jgi:hypothetical protein
MKRETSLMKTNWILTFTAVVVGALSTWTSGAPQSEKLPDGRGGEFDVTRHNIPLDQIRGGGPPKDGIPALNEPQFVSAQEGEKFLMSWDRVLGVEHNGVAKAYPIKILNWHEVVNDRIGDKPIAVSW